MADTPVTEETSAAAVNAAPEGTEALETMREEMLDSYVVKMLPDEFNEPLDFLANYPVLMSMILVGLGYLVGKLIQLVLNHIVLRLAGKTSTDYDDRLIKIAKRPAMTTPVIFSMLLVSVLLPLPDKFHWFVVAFLSSILLFSFLRAFIKATHVLLEILASRQGHSEMIQPRTIPMFEITFKVILVAIAGYLLLLIWGVDPTAWLASAGVLGIAVGFAARDSLANLFSGIFIVADAPYKIGDYIVLDTGERGEVTALGMRSTRLLTRDDIEVTIPNAIIANAKIINESGGPWEKHRIRIPVGVAYGSDVDEVTDVLMAVAEENQQMLDYPRPRVRMRAFGSSSLDFELLGWIDKPVMRGKVTNDLLKSVYKKFREEEISIPFPQSDVWVKQLPVSNDT